MQRINQIATIIGHISTLLEVNGCPLNHLIQDKDAVSTTISCFHVKQMTGKHALNPPGCSGGISKAVLQGNVSVPCN
jgi:hypothetical protein